MAMNSPGEGPGEAGTGSGSGSGGGSGGDEGAGYYEDMPQITMPNPDFDSVGLTGLGYDFNQAMATMNPLLGIKAHTAAFYGLSPQDQALVSSYADSQNTNDLSGLSDEGQAYMQTVASGSRAGESTPGDFKSMEDAGLHGMNEAATLYSQGYNPYTFGPDSMAAQQSIRNIAAGNNPYLQGALNTTQNQFTNNNPFMQGFAGFQNMQNNQLDNIFNQGADQITDKMQSQFGRAGRTGSGYHSATTGKALGDYGANLYGNAFESMQNRNLASLNQGSNAFDQGAGRSLQAASLTPGLTQSRYTDPMMLQSLGEDIDQRSFEASNSGWNNLQNYSDVLNKLQATQAAPYDLGPRTSSTDKLLGLLGTGASLYNSYNQNNTY